MRTKTITERNVWTSTTHIAHRRNNCVWGHEYSTKEMLMIILKTNHVHEMAFVCKLAFFQCCTPHIYSFSHSSLFLRFAEMCAVVASVICSLYYYIIITSMLYFVRLFIHLFLCQFTHWNGVSVHECIRDSRKSTNSESWAKYHLRVASAIDNWNRR